MWTFWGFLFFVFFTLKQPSSGVFNLCFTKLQVVYAWKIIMLHQDLAVFQSLGISSSSKRQMHLQGLVNRWYQSYHYLYNLVKTTPFHQYRLQLLPVTYSVLQSPPEKGRALFRKDVYDEYSNIQYWVFYWI